MTVIFVGIHKNGKSNYIYYLLLDKIYIKLVVYTAHVINESKIK